VFASEYGGGLRVYIAYEVDGSLGYPRSFIMAKSLAWSMEPKAFLKSM
jgi:hypothetical protein